MSAQEILEKYPLSLPVEEAAKLMNKTGMFIRCGLRAQRFSFGTAVEMQKQWSYYISTIKFLEFIGLA
jgi:hypothetical protein